MRAIIGNSHKLGTNGTDVLGSSTAIKKFEVDPIDQELRTLKRVEKLTKSFD